LRNYKELSYKQVSKGESVLLTNRALSPPEILEDHQEDIGEWPGARRLLIGRRFLKDWGMLLGISRLVKREKSRDTR